MKIRERIAELESADPKKDVEEAVLRGDWRFVGVMGYTIEVPGVENYKLYSEKYGVRVIEGTTDNIISADERRLNKVAICYANTYNKLLLQKIQNRQEKP